MKNKIFSLLILAFFTFIIPANAQNMALDFDGTDDYVTCGVINLSFQSFAIEGWFKIDALPPTSGSYMYDNIFGIESGVDAALLRINGANQKLEFVLGWNSGTQVLTSNQTMASGRWYHVAILFHHSVRNMYIVIDGKVDAGYNISGGDNNYSNNTFRIGGDGNTRSFDGQIDDVKVWRNIDRGEADIRNDMYEEIVGNETGLVAYYKLNETSGTNANDAQTSSTYDGTLTNMAGSEWTPSSAFFGPKNCFYFNGSSSYVSLGSAAYNDNFSNGTAITIEYWFKGTVLQSPVRFQDLGINYLVAGYGGNPAFIISSDGGVAGGLEIGTSSMLEDDYWHHVACTWEKNTVNGFKTYVDGILTNQRNSANVNLPIINYNGLLGAYHGPAEVLNGQLDEVRIWTDVRTETEIRENMNKTLTGNEANLVMYYNFDGYTLPNVALANYDGALANVASQSSTAFNTWLNTNSTTWETAANWSNGVPAATDNVGIYIFTTQPASSADLSANNLYLGSGSNFNFTGSLDISSNAFLNSSLTIGSGKDMTVDGDLIIESGANLTVASGGSLITNGTITNNGTFTAEKTIAGNSKWHLISAPNNNTTSSDFDGFYLQSWDEPTANWNEITELEVALTPVKGYSIFDIPAKADFSFTGTPNTGDQSISITYNDNTGEADGTNLVGNPYPSAIDWSVLDDTYGAVYVWDPSLNSGDGDYIEWNNNVGGGEQYIPPMQGFFLVTASNTTFNIGNSSRTHTGANNFYKSEKTIDNGIVLLAAQDELWIKFDEEASTDFELVSDAYKLLSLGNGQSQLYSKYGDTKLAIDVRPETELIQLGFQNNQNGNYLISVKDINGIAQAEIEDTKLNLFHDLSTRAYKFDWLTSDSEERFILHLKATGLDDIATSNTQIFAYQKTINIRSSEKLNNAKISIIDMMGRTVYEQSLVDGQNESINLPLDDGVYLVQLVSDGGTQLEKVILK